MPRREGPDRRGEVFEQDRRAAGLGADHAAARRVGHPGLGGAGHHDLTGRVAVGWIDEHVLDAGEAGEFFEFIGDAAAVGGMLGKRGFEPRQGHLAERHLLSQVAGKRLDGGSPLLGGQARVGRALGAKHALGVDVNAGGVELGDGP